MRNNRLLDLNPLAIVLAEKNKEVQRLISQSKAVSSRLAWYYDFDLERSEQSEKSILEQICALKSLLTDEQSQYDAHESRLSALSLQIGTLLNPQNWVNAEQRELRRKRKMLKATTLTIQDKITQLSNELERKQDLYEEIRADLNKHAQFDLRANEQEELELDRMLAEAYEARDNVQNRKDGIDRALAPLADQDHKLQAQYNKVTSDRTRAKQLNNRMRAHSGDSSSDRYQRKLIHEECERVFATSNPAPVANRLDREFAGIERDREKLRARAKAIAERLSRDMQAFVIDGNNLCYDNNGFIGLSALVVLARELSERAATTVVFDASIRRLLHMGDDEILGAFPRGVGIHIVSGGQEADETLLAIANQNNCSYVLSNDRFAEYFDHQAVRDGRIIRHEIVGNQIFVHDLGICLRYGS